MIGAMEYGRRTAGFLLIFAAIVAAMFVVMQGAIEKQGKSIAKLEKQIEKIQAEKPIVLPPDIMPMLRDVTSIISNQTESIKFLKTMIESQNLLNLPMKEMQPSTNGTIDLEGIDFISETEMLSKALKDHPWEMALWLLH